MPAAIATPVGKMCAVGGLLIAATLGLRSVAEDHAVTHVLSLHAVDQPGALYWSVFRDGDIALRFHDGELHPVTFHVRVLYAGCEWLGIEQLVPVDDKTFAYDYSESVLGCSPGVTPTAKTPRVGTVTVED